MAHWFTFLFVLLSPALVFAQQKTEAEYKQNQQREKALVTKEKLSRIEALDYTKRNKEWFPTGKRTFYFNTEGYLIKYTISSYDFISGADKGETWIGRYVYDASGLCDSMPTDKGIRKTGRASEFYPSCYWHLKGKRLKDGLSEVKQGVKITYCFKRD